MLRKAISKVQDIKPALSTTGGTSDARFISRWCSEVVEFGPVNNLIHKANESIPLKDIPKLTEIYYQTLVNLFFGKFKMNLENTAPLRTIRDFCQVRCNSIVKSKHLLCSRI